MLNAKLCALLRQGGRIAAIKRHRVVHNSDLRDAVAYVDRLQAGTAPR